MDSAKKKPTNFWTEVNSHGWKIHGARNTRTYFSLRATLQACLATRPFTIDEKQNGIGMPFLV